MMSQSLGTNVQLTNLLNIWRSDPYSFSFSRCTVQGCSKRTYDLICEDCAAFGRLVTPPGVWMNLYAKSKVHLGTYSAILRIFPKDVGEIIFDYLHQLCKADRQFVVLLQIKYHSILYIL